MIRALARLWRDRSGVTVVEFAAVGPVMILLLCGLLEMGYVAFARSTLESAILDASRDSRVAECPEQIAEQLQATLDRRLSVVSSHDGQPPTLVVRSYGTEFGNVETPEPFSDADGNGVRDPGEPYTDFNGNGQWDADMGRQGNYGAFGEVVQFEASYNVTSIFPFLGAQLTGGEGFYRISAETVVRNEPFKEVTC